jgi:peptide-methionine (R)-S-oxide reductase
MNDNHMNDNDKANERRGFLKLGGAALLSSAAASIALFRPSAASAKSKFAVVKTDAQWRKQLSPAAYKVLRKADTEPAFSSPLDKEKRKGTYICKGCNQPLYSSATKYDSGTGWPSFYRPLPGAIGLSTDYYIGIPRKEVHCARCGGHLGHVFNDGPKPTGKRYCMNGIAMLIKLG